MLTAVPLLAAASAHAHVVATYVLGPDEDWCTFIDQAYAGAVAMWLRALARRQAEGGAA